MSELGGIIDNVLRELLLNIYANIDSTGKRATGKTQRSLRVDLIEEPELITGRLYTPDYIDNLETGTPPKEGFNLAPGFGMELRDSLALKLVDWADAKGLIINPYATATSILDEGSKQWREGKFTNVFTEEIDELKKNLTKYIAKILLNDTSN